MLGCLRTERNEMMKIKRYEIQQCPTTRRLHVVDKKNDCFVALTMTTETKEEIEELMGRSMEEVVDASRVHPDYLQPNAQNQALTR